MNIIIEFRMLILLFVKKPTPSGSSHCEVLVMIITFLFNLRSRAGYLLNYTVFNHTSSPVALVKMMTLVF